MHACGVCCVWDPPPPNTHHASMRTLLLLRTCLCASVLICMAAKPLLAAPTFSTMLSFSCSSASSLGEGGVRACTGGQWRYTRMFSYVHSPHYHAFVQGAQGRSLLLTREMLPWHAFRTH